MGNMATSYCLTVLLLLALIGCTTTLENYEPASPDEASIKELLLRWESTWNDHDEQGHLALWHQDATIAYGRDRKKATKQEYVQILPQRMNAMPSIGVGAPKIDISGDRADVKTTLKTSGHQMPVTYHLVRQNGGWVIMSWDY